MRAAAQARPQAGGPEIGEGQLGGAGGWRPARKLARCRRGWGAPPPLCGCPPPPPPLEGVAGRWRGRSALSGSGEACSTGEAPSTLISPRGLGPAKSVGQKRELASRQLCPPSPSAPLRSRRPGLPVPGAPQEVRPSARTQTGGREGHGDGPAAKLQTAWPGSPQTQAQASPRLRGKHRHAASRRS